MKDLIRRKNVQLVMKDVTTSKSRHTTVVGVTKKLPLRMVDKEDRVPLTVDGMPTDVIETEPIYALRTKCHRPMPGGVSGGHPKVTCGTISPITVAGVKYIISNNHVIANCNDCELGDLTWQPGHHDGGTIEDTIGHLYRWVPLHFEEDESDCPIAKGAAWFANLLARLFRSHSRLCAKSVGINLVDAAVSLPMDPGDLLDEILGIGRPVGFEEAVKGENIRKSGRTTAVTASTVISVEGQARVNYGNKGTAIFDDQVITGKLAEPGDSGSLTFNYNTAINGVLFGGSDQFTVVNKIYNVLDLLRLGA